MEYSSSHVPVSSSTVVGRAGCGGTSLGSCQWNRDLDDWTPGAAGTQLCTKAIEVMRRRPLPSLPIDFVLASALQAASFLSSSKNAPAAVVGAIAACNGDFNHK